MVQKIKKILIANRGEIALRVIKTCKQLNIKTVAVFSEPDKNSLFVLAADEAYSLDGLTAQETYLDSQKILAIAKLSKTDAIHPGYGFLSENSDFAQQVIAAGLIFIGPNPDAISKMGLKSTAKLIMEQAGVNILPGYNQNDQSDEVLLNAADKIGYPVLIKAAAGGGGKGMRIVNSRAELLTQVAACKREALKSFANDQVILEKYLTNPRHIEVQILFDQHKNGVYLFERDCSLQRRYQKVIEEAPAPGISPELRKQLGDAAIKAGTAVDYVGAGTIEFLVDNNQYYFMEMNTRLQVEHPVTEMITGLDLVELQINIASGEKLNFTQQDLSINGHAVEVRLYSEDVDNNFLPSTGIINYLDFGNHDKENKYIRIDSGIKNHDEISIYYDPMLAKIIAWGETRQAAIDNLINYLYQVYIAGVKTNLKFLLNCLQHTDFQSGHITTGFIDKNLNNLITPPIDIQEYLLIAVLYLNFYSSQNDRGFSGAYNDPWQSLYNFRICLPNAQNYCIEHKTIRLECPETNDLAIKNIKLTLDNCHYACELLTSKFCNNASDLQLSINQKSFNIKVVNDNNKLYIFDKDSAQCYVYNVKNNTASNEQQVDPNALMAPMPGTIIAIKVDNGAKVKMGDALVILEAMKMEHTIFSPREGVIKDVLFKQGEQVALGEQLLVME